MVDWYEIKNIDMIDSPALAIYPERIYSNIEAAKKIAGDPSRLRPHVQANKISEVCDMMLEAGITKFKCVTIAEAEMLAMIAAPDVLLAYQPVGPMIDRFINLIKDYPRTKFSCIVDCESVAKALSEVGVKNNLVLDIFIDLNVGVNRTGTNPEKAIELAKYLVELENIHVSGLHAYDGHIQDKNIEARKKAANESFLITDKVYKLVNSLFSDSLVIVIGGSPTFPLHADETGCELSPGTFVFWDKGYSEMLPDLPFKVAAILISRVVSIIDDRHLCLNLGSKAVASESHLLCVCFLNAPDAKPITQSDEYLVVEVSDSSLYTIGDVFYGVPVHICPTVALYEKVTVILENEKVGRWRVIARNRSINI